MEKGIINNFELSSDKKIYYSLANNFFQNIDADELRNKKIEVKNKSISVLIDHEFISVPCIQINLDLYLEGIEEFFGTYHLYVQDDMTFVDEFLFLL